MLDKKACKLHREFSFKGCQVSKSEYKVRFTKLEKTKFNIKNLMKIVISFVLDSVVGSS